MRLRPFAVSLLVLAIFSVLTADASREEGAFFCEWHAGPTVISTLHPRFSWKLAGQAAYRVVVARTANDLASGTSPMWDTGNVQDSLPVAEYAGIPLVDKYTYYWQVKVWDRLGSELASSPVQQFTVKVSALPRRQGKMRTFLNFGQQEVFISRHFDLTFRSGAKRSRPSITALNYTLLTTLTMPSQHAEKLKDFVRSKGMCGPGIPEDFFLHLKEDQDIALHVGAERPENPVETRRVPGWDPINDMNGDGYVDDREYTSRPNRKAGARRKSESRIPIYYWGPPQFDYVMNISHPLYQEFLATVHIPSRLKGYDGVFIDTLTGYIPGPVRRSNTLEIRDDNMWMHSLQTLLIRIKQSIGSKSIIGNGWSSRPFIIDGRQDEEWLNMFSTMYDTGNAIRRSLELDRRDRIQLLQYNPTRYPQAHPSRKGYPGIIARDAIFGLAVYYIVQGDHTYFGFGRHPYDRPENNWFPAMEYDIGLPKGPCRAVDSAEKALFPNNLLKNHGFESWENDAKPKDWDRTEPAMTLSRKSVGGNRSAKIVTPSTETNNINSQYLVLEPYTVYTTGGYVSTQDLEGPGGAQIYPYNDDIEHIDRTDVYFKGTTPWTFCGFVFKTGKSGKVRINFRVKEAKGTAWFDDLFLVKGAHPNWKVYSREYERGLVLVKVVSDPKRWEDLKPTVIDLKGEYRQLRYDGSLGNRIGRVQLGSNEASILVKDR